MNGMERIAPSSKAECPACGSLDSELRGTDDGYLCLRECAKCHGTFSDRLTQAEIAADRTQREHRGAKNGRRR